MNTITDSLLDCIETWPNGFAIVSRTVCPDACLPRINADVCLRTPATGTTAEITVMFHLTAIVNGFEGKYLLSFFPKTPCCPSCFDVLVTHMNRRSHSIGVTLSNSTIDHDAVMITRFLHPLILKFVDENLGYLVQEEYFYFDERTVDALNTISGYRFGVMVIELKRLLKQ